MSAEGGAEQPNKVESFSQESTKISVLNHLVVESKSGVSELPQSTVSVDRAASLSPITPDSGRETRNFVFDFASPMPLASPPQKDACFNSQTTDEFCTSTSGSPRTPAKGVFDPFAPGPDKFMLAPHSNKYLQESRTTVARQLNFDSSLNFSERGKHETAAETDSDDEMLLETMYDDLLEAIFSTQTKCLPAEISPMDIETDGLKTPDSATRLTGIAETCPRAPVKRSRKSRIINQDLCRKLEF
ncbi:hypothetical protein NMG60_11035871 [Bertholletia excelsa]